MPTTFPITPVSVEETPNVTPITGIPQSSAPPDMSPGFGKNPWDVEEADYAAKVDAWQRQTIDKIDQSVLSPDEFFKGKDLSFAKDAKKARILATNDAFLSLHADGENVPVANDLSRKLLRLTVAEQLFEGRGANSEEEFHAEIGKQAQGRKDKKALIENLLSAAALDEAANLDGTKSNGFAEWKKSAMAKPGFNPEDEADLFDAWHETKQAVRNSVNEFRPQLDSVWSAFKGNGSVSAEAWKAYDALPVEQRPAFMAALRLRSQALSKNDQAAFWSNLGKQGLREIVGTVEDVASTDLYDSFTQMGLAEDQSPERAKRDLEERKVKDFAADVQRIQDTSYDPIQYLAKDGTWSQALEKGAYSAPGAVASSLVAVIPVVGTPLFYESAKENAYQDYRQKFQAAGMNYEEASKAATGLAGTGAIFEVIAERFAIKAFAGKLPFFEQAMAKATAGINSMPARILARTAAGAVEEGLLEQGQNLIYPALQDIANGLGVDVPDVKWMNGKDGVLDGFWKDSAGMLVTMLPLAIFGGARGAIQDSARAAAFRNASDLELQALGMSPDAVQAIRDGLKTGVGAASVAIDNGMASLDPTGETAKDATHEIMQAQETQRQAQSRLEQLGYAFPKISTRTDGTFAVHDGKTGEEIGVGKTLGDVQRIASTHTTAMDDMRAEQVMEMGTMLASGHFLAKAQGVETVFDLGKIFTLEEAAAKSPQAAERIADEVRLIEQAGGGTGAMALHVLGQHTTEIRDNIRQDVNTIFAGGHLGTLLEETIHGKWRAARAAGTVTRAEDIALLRAFDQVLGDRKSKAGENLRFIPEGMGDEAVSETRIEEAIGQLGQMEIFRTDKGGKNKFQLPRAVVSQHIGAVGQITGQGLAFKFKSFIEALRARMGLVMSRVAVMKKSERDGKFDRAGYEAYLDKLIGTDVQKAHDDGVRAELNRILAIPDSIEDDNIPFSIGRSNERLDANGNSQGIDTNNPGGANIGDAAQPGNSAVTPEMDAAYLGAAENGDLIACQKLVNDAASRIGCMVNDDGDLKVWLNGSKNEEFEGLIPKLEYGGQSGHSKEKLFFLTDYPVEAVAYTNEDKLVEWPDLYQDANFGGLSEGILDGRNSTPYKHPDGSGVVTVWYAKPLKLKVIDGEAKSGYQSSSGKEYWKLNSSADNIIKEEGASSVMLKNVAVTGWMYDSNHLLVGRENDVFRADAIIRDSTGNVIPLSRRFNLSTPADSGAFSIGPADVAGMMAGNALARIQDPRRRVHAMSDSIEDDNIPFSIGRAEEFLSKLESDAKSDPLETPRRNHMIQAGLFDTVLESARNDKQPILRIGDYKAGQGSTYAEWEDEDGQKFKFRITDHDRQLSSITNHRKPNFTITDGTSDVGESNGDWIDAISWLQDHADNFKAPARIQKIIDRRDEISKIKRQIAEAKHASETDPIEDQLLKEWQSVKMFDENWNEIPGSKEKQTAAFQSLRAYRNQKNSPPQSAEAGRKMSEDRASSVAGNESRQSLGPQYEAGTGQDASAFSIGPADLAGMMAGNALARIQDPRRRVHAMSRIARDFDGIRMQVERLLHLGGRKRSRYELRAEANARQELAYEEKLGAIHARYGSLLADDDLVKIKAQKVHAYLADPDSPLRGRLMSKTAAIKAYPDRFQIHAAGEYDGSDAVSRSVFGGMRMPDQAAQDLYDEGLISEPTPDAMWEALVSEQNSVAGMKEMLVKAQEEMREARREAKQEANDWLATQGRDQETNFSPKEEIIRSLRMLDAILLALPAEVRGRIGGYTQMARITTDQSRLAFLKDKLDKADKELESFLRTEFDKEFTEIMRKARPKKDAPGERPTGSIGADAYDILRIAEAAASLDFAHGEAEADKYDALADNPDTDLKEADKYRAIAQMIRLTMNWTKADAARREQAVIEADKIYFGGLGALAIENSRRRERLGELRKSALAGTKKSGHRTERESARTNAAKPSKAATGLAWELLSFGQVCNVLFGEKSAAGKWFNAKELAASNAYEDGFQAKANAMEAMFESLSGSRFGGEKLRHRMATEKTITVTDALGVEQTFTDAEAITALLMWRQEDGRRHMEGITDEEGNVVSSWAWNEAAMADMEKQLSPAGAAMMSFMGDSYGTEYGRINEVFRKIWNVSMPRHKMYAPITVAPVQGKGDTITDPVSGDSMGVGMTPGSLKNRSNTAVAEPLFKDAFQVFLSHARQMEHFIAYAEFSRDALAIINRRESRNAIEAVHPNAATTLSKWIDYFALGGIRDANMGSAGNQWLGRRIGGLSQVALVGRVSVLAMQSLQLGAAAYQMPVGAFLTRLARLHLGMLDWKGAFQSEYIQRRIEQMPPVVRDAVMGLSSGTPNRAKYYAGELGKTIAGADGLFTAGTYAIFYDYHLMLAKQDKSIAEPEQYAHAEAERLTDQVAQPTRAGARSWMEVANQSNPAFRVGWNFSSDPRQKVALGIYEMMRRDKSTLEKIKPVAKSLAITWAVSGVLQTLLRAIIRDLREPDDDEVFDERHWNPLRLALMAATGPFGAIPYFGDMLEGSTYAATGQYMPSGGILSAIPRAAALIPKWMDGNFDLLKDAEKVFDAGGAFSGTSAFAASVMHMIRDAVGIVENMVGD